MNLTDVSTLITTQITALGTFVSTVWTALFPFLVVLACLSLAVAIVYRLVRRVRA